MRAVLIWRDIGNYHLARSRALHEKSYLEVESVEVCGQAGFGQFRPLPSEFSTFRYHGLGLSKQIEWQSVSKLLVRLLKQLRPDVVYVPGWSMVEALVALEWCVAQRVPAVIMSDSKRAMGRRTPHKEILKRGVVRQAAAAFVAGTPQAEYIMALGMPRARVFLGYDAVDNERFSESVRGVHAEAPALRVRFGLPEHFLLCCARLIPEKNLPRLIEAYRIYVYHAVRVAWPLVIIGPGPMETELRTLIQAHGLTDLVQLKGALSYDDIQIFYGLAEALILPSVSETWGLVVNEAMASGLPVLVSRQCGCVDDLVEEGRNGFTFDAYDVDAIASAVIRIAEPECNRVAMGLESRAIIENWGLGRFVSGFEAAARAAVSMPKRRAGFLDRILLKALMLR